MPVLTKVLVAILDVVMAELREHERMDALQPVILSAAGIEVDFVVGEPDGESGAVVERRVHLEVTIVVFDLPA